MKTGKFLIFALILSLFVSSCSKEVTVDVDDAISFCDTSYFHGCQPGLSYYGLIDSAGEPSEFVDTKDNDEICHNPVYYSKEGTVTCYWSGGQEDPIGLVRFTPHSNIHIHASELISYPIDWYDITSKTKKVKVYQGDTLFFIIHLKDLEVKSFSYLKRSK